MAIRGAELMFTGSTTPYTSYDSTKTNLGQWIQQKNLGANPSDKFAGPFPVSVARPMEASTVIQVGYPHVIDAGGNQHWVFLAELSAAAATRRIVLYRYDTSSQAWSWRGFVTLTYPAATAHTIRGMRVVRHTYSTGTVAVSGTAVTGTGTAWATARYAVGGRIGFGSTNPLNITTWYPISAMASDTGITIVGNAGTISSGTSYVIEELRIYTVTTNATATNGGLFVAKGVNYDDFVSGGVTIAAATTTDNLKAVYWLADAVTALNTAAGGMGLSSTVSDTSQDIYVLNADSGTSARIYKYNGRASLASLSAGRSTSAFLFRTGAQAVTGTISQTNSSRLATLSHGPGSGTSCLYFATTTRICRCPESSIVDASVSFVSDSMVEIPTGGVNTFAAISALSSVEYAGTIDRLIVTTSAGNRNYVTQYNTASNPIDKVFGCDNKQLDQSTADSGLAIYPGTQGSPFSVWAENGIAYICRLGASTVGNHLYAVPFGADWDFAAGNGGSTQNRLITPSISTPNCLSYRRMVSLREKIIGSDNLGIPPDAFRTYYRTTGITDNSGSWSAVPDNGDLTGVAGAANIQFMYEFKVIGQFCLPARIFGLVLTYDDTSTDSHYQPSVKHSSISAKRFAWRFSTAWGSTVPTMTVRLYDAVTDSLLLTDTSATAASGVWEKTTNDGGVWSSYDTSDKTNETTYVRYTPTSLADNIRVRALLTNY